MSLPAGWGPLRLELRALRRESGTPVAFAGLVDGRTLRLTEFIGTRTDAMHGLEVQMGAGLGGRVAALGRPVAVDDYCGASGITHHYDPQVLDEGLGAVAAAPVSVRRRPAAVLYTAVYERIELGDRLKAALAAAAQRLSIELTVHHEVERRLATMEAAASAATTSSLDRSDLELVRQVHADLRLAVGEIDDPLVRDRVVEACRRLADLGVDRKQGIVVAPRELDVLAQVSLGCTNAETAHRLGLTPETIKSYLRSAMRKLDASTRHEAVVRARMHGLIP